MVQVGVRRPADQAERAGGNRWGYQGLEASGEGHEVPEAAV